MAKTTTTGTVRPCSPERAAGKFEAVFADGTVDPYAYRTEAEARAAIDKHDGVSADDETESKDAPKP